MQDGEGLSRDSRIRAAKPINFGVEACWDGKEAFVYQNPHLAFCQVQCGILRSESGVGHSKF